MLTSSYTISLTLLFPALLLLLYFSSLNQNHSITSFPLSTTVYSMRIQQNSQLDSFISAKLYSKENNSSVVKKNNLEGVEEDLARARAAIKKAILSKNFMSYKDEKFTLKGSIYRNPYAFYQSHIEMVKRFKVWSYKEGEIPSVHHGPMKDIYAIEGQFIAEMESGMSPFMASHPDEAHAFFIPISVANIVEYVYKPITNYSREKLQMVVEDYVHVLANKYPYWNRSKGADHFMVACHDWAPDATSGNTELFKNFIRVICNANTSEGFNPQRDVSLTEVYGPPYDLGTPHPGLPPQKRKILAFYAGRAHGYIREILLKHWKEKDEDVRVFEYLPESENYTKFMTQSKFCLCPSGFEVATARPVESIYAGCVPVIISDNYSLPFSDVLEWSQFSVSIQVDQIPKIKEILQAIPEEKYLKMQKRVRRLQRHFKVNRPAQPFDQIHMVLHSVWLRRLNFRLSTV